MKTPTASSATSSQREQTSLLSQMPRSPRSNVCSMPDPENPSASVHPKRFSTPSLTLKISMRWEVESAFGKMDQFSDQARHPKWKEVNVATEMPGWTRFKPAAQWIAEHRIAAT